MSRRESPVSDDIHDEESSHGGDPGRDRYPDDYPYGARDPQEAQAALILQRYNAVLQPGPANWREAGIQFFVRRDYVVADVAYAEAVRSALSGDEAEDDLLAPQDTGVTDEDAPPDGTIKHGTEWIRLRPGTDTFAGLAAIHRRAPRIPPDKYGPEYALSITS